MSSFFGGVRGHENPGLKEANRRSRLHLARDINDEAALARDVEPPIRRTRHWLWFSAAAVALGVFALIGGRGSDDVPVTPSCSEAAIAVASSQVTAGDPLAYRVTGPEGADYVVTLDGQPVRGDAGTLISYRQTDAGPAFRLQQCLSPTLRIAAPAGNGAHQLAVLRVAPDGSGTPVADTTVTVTGTP
jgi:hypothetical protein